MGGISEMKEEGILCEHCGMYIGEPTGHWRYCEDCAKEEAEIEFPTEPIDVLVHRALYGGK